VVVVLVDEHDFDVALAQLLSRADPAEAAAEDDDARPCAIRVASSAHLVQQYGPAALARSPQVDEAADYARGYLTR
jgi:hypothetical protein